MRKALHLDRCRLAGLPSQRPVPISGRSLASRESHSAQAHTPQRPPVYVSASSLFRVERPSISVLVVDSTTGGEACATPTMPGEAPSDSHVIRGGRQPQSQGNTTGDAASPAEGYETVICENVGLTRPAPERYRRRTATRRLAFAIEGGDRLHDVLELFVGQFRIDGKREHFFSGTLRLRERTLLIT